MRTALRKYLLLYSLSAAGSFLPAKTFGQHGDISARLVVTTDFQKNIFSPGLLSESYGHSPGYYSVYLARAYTYVKAYREHLGPEKVILVNCGEDLGYVYRHYPEDITARVSGFMGYDTAEPRPVGDKELRFLVFGSDPEENHRILDGCTGPEEAVFTVGLFASPRTDALAIAKTAKTDLAVAAYGPDPEVCRIMNFRGDTVTVVNTGTSGRHLAVIDLVEGRFYPKIVDITGFDPDPEYLSRFRPLSDSVRRYFLEPLTLFTRNVWADESFYGPSVFCSLFHRFQLETTGAEISFFAPPRRGILFFAGAVVRKDLFGIFPYDNELCVMEMSGAEIRDYLEYACDRRFRTMRSETDNLLKLRRDADGGLSPVYPIHQWDTAAGIEYTVNVTRNYGSRVEILRMTGGGPFDPERIYRVAVNSHRAAGGGGHITAGAGIGPEELPERTVYWSDPDYRSLLGEWLSEQERIEPEIMEKWTVVPGEWVEKAKERESPHLRSISP